MTQCPYHNLGPLPEFFAPGGPDEDDVRQIVTPTGDKMWLVRDYALGRLVLADKRFSRTAAVRPGAPTFNDAQPVPESMMSRDGKEHARLRKTVAGHFTARRMAAMAPRVERLTDRYLDRLESAGPGADLMEGLADPLPLDVLCQLLGVPLEDGATFRDWVEVLFDISASSPQEKGRKRLELSAYMADLLAEKRSAPQDDLLTSLIQAQDRGELTPGELITLGLTLLMAGYETTVGQIATSAHVLLSEPGAYRELVDHPDRVDAAVEELMRVSPTTPLSFSRVAVEPVRLGSVLVQAGDGVMVSLLNGNRDGKVYPEPEYLAPESRDNVHLTFGHGLHRCLGAPLARLQLQIVFGRLVRRFPHLRFADVPEPAVWKDGMGTRGLSRLLVDW
ncbi:cytochrome P450 [Streptomyces sp. XD-27]|uniref:cytochrome P450 n=1 Tax=Streptomyces sp. XD-27 TaxID=3062779 RepID=UPI0026F46138|nr:cytochrome P450 [Streptomyces sp. XD-27]WKX68651.1 cytochrome P450 [Streptomyces sp. XD-27]